MKRLLFVAVSSALAVFLLVSGAGVGIGTVLAQDYDNSDFREVRGGCLNTNEAQDSISEWRHTFYTDEHCGDFTVFVEENSQGYLRYTFLEDSNSTRTFFVKEPKVNESVGDGYNMYVDGDKVSEDMVTYKGNDYYRYNVSSGETVFEFTGDEDKVTGESTDDSGTYLNANATGGGGTGGTTVQDLLYIGAPIILVVLVIFGIRRKNSGKQVYVK